MKKCILCNKPLYKDLSFQNIFKHHYHIHCNCLTLLNKTNLITFPFLEILVHIHILFPSNSKKINKSKLFTLYGSHYFDKLHQTTDASIIYLVDEFMTDIDFLLIAKLCTESLLLLTYTNEDFLIPNES